MKKARPYASYNRRNFVYIREAYACYPPDGSGSLIIYFEAGLEHYKLFLVDTAADMELQNLEK
jgi:hypothetical protein